LPGAFFIAQLGKDAAIALLCAAGLKNDFETDHSEATSAKRVIGSAAALNLPDQGK
jgi:hypothetical protein